MARRVHVDEAEVLHVPGAGRVLQRGERLGPVGQRGADRRDHERAAVAPEGVLQKERQLALAVRDGERPADARGGWVGLGGGGSSSRGGGGGLRLLLLLKGVAGEGGEDVGERGQGQVDALRLGLPRPLGAREREPGACACACACTCMECVIVGAGLSIYVVITSQDAVEHAWTNAKQARMYARTHARTARCPPGPRG